MLGRKQKAWILTGLVILLSLYACPHVFSAKAEVPVVTQLDQLSGQVYEFIKAEQYEEAKEKLDELAVLFSGQRTELDLNIEELEMMARTIVSAKRAFSAVQADAGRLHWYALQIRLMCDALSHDHQPLWINYYSLFSKQVDGMSRHAAKQDQALFSNELKQNHQLYLTLRPAILISRSADKAEGLDSLYSFLLTEGQKQGVKWEIILEVLQQLKEHGRQVFQQEEMPTTGYGISAGSPYLIIGGIGIIIIPTLAYVVWRKYKGEKNSVFRAR